MNYICAFCKKVFRAKASAKRKYCSSDCMHKSQEWRRKQSKAKMGKPGYWINKKRPEETKEKISQSLKGNIPWNKGKKTGFVPKAAFQKGNPGYWLGKKRDKETMEKLRLSHLGKKMTEEQKIKIGKRSKAMWADPVFKEQMIKKMWGNPEFMKKLLKQQRRKPSNPEKVFDELTPDNVRYVGDWSWWRTLPNGKNKNPDFKITGQNKVIEIFGGKDFFHTEKEAKELKESYKQVGLECLIIWEKEIYNQQDLIKNKIDKFIEV